MADEPSIAHGATMPRVAQDVGVLSRYQGWVTTTPDAPAVSDGPASWTYRELDTIATGVVDALAPAVGQGDVVAVCLDRSVAQVGTAVALARLGAVYLPLGPRVGARRLDVLTSTVRVTSVVGSSDMLAGRGCPVRLDVPDTGANAVPAVAAAVLAPGPDAVAAPAGAFYAVLTTGSTGTPKAVAIGQAALANAVHFYNEAARVEPGDRLSLLVAAQFDPHISELWCGLSAGAVLAIAPDDVRYDPGRLMEWITRADVAVGHVATPVAERVLAAPWPQDSPLRHMFIGGERLRSRPRAEVTATVQNVYGPAEAIIATAAVIGPGADHELPPIGAPVAGVSVCVVDDDGQVVDRGDPGELLIGGACVGIGYVDATLTAERYVSAPEGSGLGRVYRTRDRVRMRPDGVLEYLGRLDGQVKINGVRIEPYEVESVIEQDPSVSRAVVAVRRHASGATTLAAFLLPADGRTVEVADLLAHASSALPEQAVPGELHIVDGFPLNHNGKVDVPALFDALGSSETEYLVTQTQRQLADMWRRLLKVDQVHAGSNLFELGGSSMDAFQLTHAIQADFGVHLPMKSIMNLRTLGALAAAIDAEKSLDQRVDRDSTNITEW